MSNQINSGIPKMAFVNEVPWHGLGEKLPNTASIDDWKQAANLNWSAMSSPVMFEGKGAKIANLDDRVVLWRSDTGSPLSVVSDSYNVVQPGEILEFFRELVSDLGGFKLETAGHLRGGRKLWALAKADDDIMLGDDKIKRYLLLATSYDLSIQTIAAQTSIRVVCSNTLSAALSKGDNNTIQVNHRQQFDGDKVKKQIALAEEWKLFGEVIKKLADKRIKEPQAEVFFQHLLYPNHKKGEPVSKSQGRKIEQLMGIYHAAPGQTLPSADDTAWGLVNAITYYTDHAAKSRSGNDGRLDKAWFGDFANLKARAFSAAVAI